MATASEASLAEQLGNAKSLQDIFRLVKEGVWKHFRMDQAGLMVGLADMGVSAEGVLGAYYSPDANTIVMNRAVMKRLKAAASQHAYNSYCFYILLHEYLHSCGFYDEQENRQVVAALALEEFGPEHAVTRLATGAGTMQDILLHSTLSGRVDAASADNAQGIEFVEGIDRDNTNYIS